MNRSPVVEGENIWGERAYNYHEYNMYDIIIYLINYVTWYIWWYNIAYKVLVLFWLFSKNWICCNREHNLFYFFVKFKKISNWRSKFQNPPRNLSLPEVVRSHMSIGGRYCLVNAGVSPRTTGVPGKEKKKRKKRKSLLADGHVITTWPRLFCVFCRTAWTLFSGYGASSYPGKIESLAARLFSTRISGTCTSWGKNRHFG